MKTIKKDTETLYVRASVVNNTFNKDSKTFQITFATETPVLRNLWDGDSFFEVLLCNPANVRQDRMKQGLPLFDNHPFNKQAQIQLGKVSDVKFENKALVGTVTLGARADEALISDIENGIHTSFSVGYNVYAFKELPLTKGETTPTLQATDWEPLEVSFAPVPADINSNIRTNNALDKHLTLISKQMAKTIDEVRASGTDEEKARLEAITKAARAFKMNDEKAFGFYNQEDALDVVLQNIITEGSRAVEAPTTVEPKKVEEVNLENVRATATKEDRDRLDSILKSTRAAKIDDAKAIEYHLSGKPIEEIRQAIIEEFTKKDPKVQTIHVGEQSIDKKRDAIEEGLLHRIAPATFKEGNMFSGRSLVQIAEELLVERGVNTRAMSNTQIVDYYFAKRDASTSDFPLLLEQLSNKLLRTDYPWQPEYWNMIARETSVSNFKPKNFYQFDSNNGMDQIIEGDEIKYGKMVEAKQTLSVSSYGEGVKFTRKAMINDDLSAFEKIPQRFVLDWQTMQGDMIWNMLLNNIKMDDGNALFSAAHNNYVATGSGAALSETTLQAAVVNFKRQYGINGKRRIRVLPKYLIVGPEQEVAAYQLLHTVLATQTSQVNPFSNMGLTLITEPRLDANGWYLAADPAAIDGLYYAYLDGNGGLRSYRVEDFDTDSIKFAVRGEFGCAAIDHRGWYKNAGK